MGDPLYERLGPGAAAVTGVEYTDPRTGYQTDPSGRLVYDNYGAPVRPGTTASSARPVPGQSHAALSPMAQPAPVPDISPMLRAVQHIQGTFGVSPEASAVLTRALYAPVMSHPEMQRWLNVAYPQPQAPAPQNPQQAAARLAQMALLFGQHQ